MDDADVDLITELAYDPADRTMFSSDELGRRDWTAYDSLGRAARTIHNAAGKATDGTVDDPRSAGYHANDNLSDQDQISRIDYDANGRRWRTRDNLGNVRPLRPRSFNTLSQAEEENGQSRIYLGIHWSFDKTEAIAQGEKVADWVSTHSLLGH